MPLAAVLLGGAGCGAQAQDGAQVRAAAASAQAPPALGNPGLPRADKAAPVPRELRPDGGASPAGADPPAGAPGTRLFAFDGFERIRLEPQWDAPIIGMFRAGQSVKARGPLRGPEVGHCSGGWYAVEPRGFVCAGRSSTTSPDHPGVAAAAEVLPDTSASLPFKVGVSTGAPIYLRLPTAAEQRKEEPGLDRHLASPPADDDAQGGAVDRSPAGAGPSRALERHFGAAGGRPLTAKRGAFPGMRVAWSREFDAAGRTWLVTLDLGLVPKDKVRVKATPTLQGVRLDQPGAPELPIAYMWLDPVPKLKKDDQGKLVDSGERWARHAFVPVRGDMVRTRSGYVLEAEDGAFMRRELVTVLREAKALPRGVGPRDKWVHVRITHGFMVAYEGAKPVFATAISPGVDAASLKGHSTPMGQYVVYSKALSWDMAGVEKRQEWMVDEVPWTAFFLDSYALHGAWWHDDFGRPKSHGCVNIPPADARHLFGWLDPPLPEGWYAVGAYYPAVKGTTVVLKPWPCAPFGRGGARLPVSAEPNGPAPTTEELLAALDVEALEEEPGCGSPSTPPASASTLPSRCSRSRPT